MIREFFPQSSRSGVQRRRSCENRVGSDPTGDYHRFGYDYFDNPNLQVGYNGYRYDGRFAEAAAKMAGHYGLMENGRVLEIGCAKGFVLVEFFKLGLRVAGLDASEYAIRNAHPQVRSFMALGDACRLPFGDAAFDFVLGKEVLPHVPENKVSSAVWECMRVSKGPVFFEIQTGETPLEREYMKRWDGTHATIRPQVWWEDLFGRLEYKGDVHYKVLVPERDND